MLQDQPEVRHNGTAELWLKHCCKKVLLRTIFILLRGSACELSACATVLLFNSVHVLASEGA